MPAEFLTREMLRAVEAVAAQFGQIDSADEGDLVIDDDQLFVVAVNRVLASVELTANPGALAEPVADAAHGLASR